VSGISFGLQRGRIRAFLAVTCGVCEELTALPGNNVIKAGAFAREKGWRIDRASGGWICPTCDGEMGDYIEALRTRRSDARASLAQWRASLREERAVTA
jgi:hypothetical protein